jgi:hypothetical protein
MQKIVCLLRNGDFLTRERMTLWSWGLILGLMFCVIFLGLSAHGPNDYAGRPLGTDFSNVYAAGVAAAHGDATAPFDVYRQLKAERAIFGPATPFYGWHYPPFFLFVAVALAVFPYVLALILFQSASLLLYLGSIWLLLRKSAMPGLSRDRLWLLLALGFTAVFVNLIHGQNGFLTTALFAAALALLDERPFVAGALFGLLCYKPQFAVVIPFVLVATGRWRTLIGAVVTVLLLSVAVTATFGWSVWPAFLDSMRFTRTVVLEQGNTGLYKIQSAFAWVRLWRGTIGQAYGIQAIVALAVMIALLRIWRGSIATAYKKSALCLAALLITPYCMDYDLMLLAPVIALLAAEGKVRGFANYEILCLTLLWFVPSVARNIAYATFIPLAVPAMAFSFGLIYRRRNAQKQPGDASHAAQIASW